MRILYHHRTLGDGAEGIHIAEMVSAFRELGHEVELMGLAGGAPTGAEPGRLARARHLLPEVVHEVAGLGCNAVEYRAVTRGIDAFRPDVIYKRHARNDVATLAAARARGIPSALEVNCLYGSESYQRFEPLTFRRLARALERRAISLATRVFAVSSPLAESVRELGTTPVTVLPNGANPVTFSPGSCTSREARVGLGLREAPTVGWSGIVRDWHGLTLLLDVLARVSEVRLLVIGDGPGRQDLEARAARLGLSDRVTITGRVPHERMGQYLQALDVAVVPDERTGVASPMKLLEYMAMALTVVAPDAPNIRDVVSPDVDGVLFRPADREALAAAIARLVRDPDLRQRLGSHARLKVERERNWQHNARLVLELLTADAEAAGAPIGAVQERRIQEQQVYDSHPAIGGSRQGTRQPSRPIRHGRQRS